MLGRLHSTVGQLPPYHVATGEPEKSGWGKSSVGTTGSSRELSSSSSVAPTDTGLQQQRGEVLGPGIAIVACLT